VEEIDLGTHRFLAHDVDRRSDAEDDTDKNAKDGARKGGKTQAGKGGAPKPPPNRQENGQPEPATAKKRHFWFGDNWDS
jgi:hypothetical protein